MGNFCILYSTFASLADAEKAATRLLKQRLIACAVFLPGNSLFWWKGKIDRAQ